MVRRNGQRGFTLMELLVVVTIVGILSGLAMVNVKNANRRAKEETLVYNLHAMRSAIDSYYADKQKYPASLEDLSPDYMREIPKDPITDSRDTWIEIFDEPSTDSSDPFGFDSFDSDDFDSSVPGVQDVKSGAEGMTMQPNSVPYSEL